MRLAKRKVCETVISVVMRLVETTATKREPMRRKFATVPSTARSKIARRLLKKLLLYRDQEASSMMGGSKYKKNMSAVKSGRTMSLNIEMVVLPTSGSALSP